MEDGLVVTFVTLGIALWGAVLSTYLALARRRRRILVRAEFGTERLGSVRNHAFFVVSVANVGQRAVTIREIEWEVDPSYKFTLNVFRHSKGKDLPVKVEADEELRILFDSDAAAMAIAPSQRGTTSIDVIDASEKRRWTIDITQTMREEAEEEIERSAEQEA
jgi:hypothetical protein